MLTNRKSRVWFKVIMEEKRKRDVNATSADGYVFP